MQQILGSISPPDVLSTRLFFERVDVDDSPAGFLFGGRFAAVAVQAFSSAFLAFSSTFFASSSARLARSAAFLFYSSSICFFFSSLSLFHFSFSSISSLFLCSFPSISFVESALVNSLARGQGFFGANGVAAVGSTRCLDISDSLPLCILLSPVELEVPDPGHTFFR